MDQFDFGNLALKEDGFKDLLYRVLCGAGYEVAGSYEVEGDSYLRHLIWARHSGNTGGGTGYVQSHDRDGMVPEPSAALVFSMGMLFAGARLRRQRN